MNCDAADTLCVAEKALSRLKAATAGLRSIQRIDIERQAIVSDLYTRIDIRGGIIDDLKKVDTNSQKIDSNSIENARLYQAQISDDKLRIGDLQHRLDSCQSNEKWIFGAGALAGGFVGYKIRGAVPQLFGSSTPATVAQPYPLSFYQRTNAEKTIQQALTVKK